MFTITKNHVTEGYTPTIATMPLYGLEKAMGNFGEDDVLPTARDKPPVEFRMYDDDGELYYEGVVDDDDECINQSAALRFGEADAGCTTIKVKRDGEWKQEIG